MSPLLTLSLDTALLLLTCGMLLVYLELNRPGLILPGAAGLTLCLLALARFFSQPMHPFAAASCLAGFALLLASTRTRTHVALAVLATAALLYGFLRLAPEASGNLPHVYVALSCAVFLGVGTSFLTTIAARARQNKGLDLK